MFKELMEKQPCSVSKELVEYVARLLPDTLMDSNGSPKITETLFYLGFKIKPHNKNLNYYTLPHVLIRDNSMPHKVYRTTVYNSQLRNEAVGIDVNGKIRYNNKSHWLKKYYDKFEILTPTNIGEIIAKDLIQDISEIGTLENYHGN